MPAARKAQTTKSLFKRETRVSTLITAKIEKIWSLLTSAATYPSWNSTIISIEGDIQPFARIVLKSTLDAKRSFKLTIRDFQAPTLLSWGDAMGTRVYTLLDNGNGTVDFSMVEKIGGPLFPFFSRLLPSFDDSFNRFAADLKKAAETA